jgi:membrane-associated protease RseP (regulator of RpoE activity)
MTPVIILAIILGFSLTVFVHELGHFIMARRAGIYVEKFSIGMGPKAFTLYKDKQGTEYILSYIPVGGFVKMKGQEDLPKELDISRIDEDSFLAKKPLPKLSVILAGVVMNVIFAYILISIAFLIGIPFESNKVGGVKPYSPAWEAGLKRGDVIIKIGNDKTITGEDVFEKIAMSEAGENISIIYVRNNETNEILIAPEINDEGGVPLSSIGIMMWNGVVAKSISENTELYNNGLRNDMIITVKNMKNNTVYKGWTGVTSFIENNPGAPVEITGYDKKDKKKVSFLYSVLKTNVAGRGYMTKAVVDTVSGYPASKAGIENGDEIISINGNKIKGYDDIIPYTTASGRPLQITYKRSSNTYKTTVKPVYLDYQEHYLVGMMPSQSSLDESRTVSWVDPVFSKLPDELSLHIGDIVNGLKEDPLTGNITYLITRNDEKLTLVIEKENAAVRSAGYVFVMDREEKIVKYPFPSAFIQGVPQIKRELKSVLNGITRLFRGKMSIKVFGGPIKIVQSTYLAGKHKGIVYLIMIFVKIGISLAIINLLPIPGLDGGHAVFIIYELIFNKPPPQKAMLFLQGIGLLLILLLFFVVSFNDIVGLFR